ncbi:MAG: hypothetical protein KDB86_11295 [Actinobacteria bacterium]|nr:hypothetical protein [Actinomycetota bacterium]MCB9388176.1 hypothetical protein [Acidimicrobiia bacterium]
MQRRIDAVGRVRRWMVVAVATMLACGLFANPRPVGASPLPWIINVGDSWSVRNIAALPAAFSGRAHVVTIPVTSYWARDWRKDPIFGLTQVRLAVNSAPPNSVVYLSLGGPDLRDVLRGNAPDTTEADIGWVIDQILAMRDDLRVIIPGYDLPNLTVEDYCREEAMRIAGTLDPVPGNTAFLGLRDIYNRLGASRPRVVAPDLWGFLQGRPGDPDLTQWTPAELMSDCTHPTLRGFERRAKALAAMVDI